MTFLSDSELNNSLIENKTLSQVVKEERTKRRTFAIISHPDAGKTTLTEKLLLYSGMIRTAGMVRGRKGSRAASSDWMAMEQERGISITASAMQFPYKNTLINVLDTPGHQDFSEDTYRTLTAADCAIMVIDAGKGVEIQTRKLFQVCRLRNIPILTFINKLDLPARDPFSLMQELEELLNIEASPRNWPIGNGKNFKGVVDLIDNKVRLYERGAPGGATKITAAELTLEQFYSFTKIEKDLRDSVRDDLELLQGAGNPFTSESFLAGKITPVFFGSALTNFGVEEFFDRFIEISPPPHSYDIINEDSSKGYLSADESFFSGFIFKIQANMNPKHRDSMAFIRVCSGEFIRDMNVEHRSSKSNDKKSSRSLRLSRSFTMKANERDTIDAAYPGDIVGVINPGSFAIGDTIVGVKSDSDKKIPYFQFPPLPQFPPEVVARIRPKEVLKVKSFQKGIEQLTSEGAVQLLRSYSDPDSPPYVAAVGQLQFEVLQHRLQNEYNVATILDVLSYRYSVYLKPLDTSVKLDKLVLSGGAVLTLDSFNRLVLLYSSDWQKNYILEQNKGIELIEFLNG
jgi:peptide chain release factor 3